MKKTYLLICISLLASMAQGIETNTPSDVAAAPPVGYESENEKAGFGEAKSTAIEVCRPSGEHSYLRNLQCPDGSLVDYKRTGSVGNRNKLPNNYTEELDRMISEQNRSGLPLAAGETDYHIIDAYAVSCGVTKRIIYMDMYHCDQSFTTEAPRGFVLRQSDSFSPDKAKSIFVFAAYLQEISKGCLFPKDFKDKVERLVSDAMPFRPYLSDDTRIFLRHEIELSVAKKLLTSKEESCREVPNLVKEFFSGAEQK